MAWMMIAGAGWLESAPFPPKLRGIAEVGSTSFALLELTEPSNGMVTTPILRKGDRQGAFEVLEINNETGSAVVSSPTGKQTLQVYANQAPAHRVLNLNQARLDQVLDMYQEMGSFTVVHPVLISFRIDLQIDPSLPAAEAVPLLEKVLGENGLVLEHRGNFVLIVPKDGASLLSMIPAPPAPPPVQPGSPALKLFPPGLIKFQEADLSQVLDVYAELADKNLLTSPVVPPTKVTVRSQTSMSLEEAIWMMGALLRMGGIATVPAGKSFIFVVPAEQAKTLPAYNEKALAAAPGANGSMSQLKFDAAPLKNLLDLCAH
jgi:type II secretory pathway component GspD/PulD (secretin)